MKREETKQRILEKKVLAVVRMKDPANLFKVIEALLKGGVAGIELTMTIPGAIELLEKTAKEFGDSILLGVGSVTDTQTALAAINSGATFVVSPIFKPEIVKATIEKDIVSIPGTFTPTEAQLAYEAGADFCKVFPADNLGMSYIKSIKAPLPHLQIIPTGGVTLDNAIDWINHGASAVGVGSALVSKKAVENNDFNQLTENAIKLCTNLGLA